MKKNDLDELCEKFVKTDSAFNLDVSPEDMLEGTLLDEQFGLYLSLSDQQWAIKTVLNSCKSTLTLLEQQYHSEKTTYAQYQDGEYLHDLFDKIRYLGGAYAFQFIVFQSSFIENLLTHSYSRIVKNYKNDAQGTNSSKVTYIIDRLIDAGVRITKNDRDFLKLLYGWRNKFTHNQIELSAKSIDNILKESPSEYWSIYYRDKKPFFLTITNDMENEFYSCLSRLIHSLGEYLLESPRRAPA